MKSFISITALFCLLSTSCVAPVKKTESTTNKKPYAVSYGFDPQRKQANASSVYKTSGLCNGLPRVSIKTAPGFCVGLVDSGEGLIKPRYALQIDRTHILVTDMGGWRPNNGQIYLLTYNNKTWIRSSLLNSKNITADQKCILNETQQLIKGPNDELYITSIDCIATLKLTPNYSIENIDIKISNLPTVGLHALKVITFDSTGNIYMNAGSVTDNCETETTNVCQETQGQDGRAVIRKYLRNSDGSYDPSFSIFARGQRNSMALYWDKKNNALWTGENSRDYVDRKDSRLNGNELPSDEMNVITKEGTELDWPYCYDDGQKSPEFPDADCSQYQHPYLLFPAHSAPLGFLMYTGKLFPAWYQNRLFVSLHGYANYGHRIVTYKRNDQFQPIGAPLSLIYGWEAEATTGQLVGSPVGITQGVDGSVFITEDNSQKILQLYYDAKEGNGTPVAELKIGTSQQDLAKLSTDFQKAEAKRQVTFVAKLKQPNVPLFTQIQNKVIDQNCTMCHGGINYPGVQLLKYDDIGNYKKLKDQLWLRLNGQGVPPMPPSGLPEETKSQLFELVNKWVDAGYPAP